MRNPIKTRWRKYWPYLLAFVLVSAASSPYVAHNQAENEPEQARCTTDADCLEKFGPCDGLPGCYM